MSVRDDDGGVFFLHNLSLNREGRWGTTDDFTTSFLHFSLFSTALWDLTNSRPAHSLMLSSHLFFDLLCLLPRFTVPYKMVLARLESLLVERRTRYRKVASSNPGKNGVENFLLQSQLCVLTLIRCPFHLRHRSSCKKCRSQVTPKYAYTFDPTKSEWADYAAVQA